MLERLRSFLLLLAIVTAFGLDTSQANAKPCPLDVSALVGTYDFTTMSTGSKDGRGIGTRGFYRAIFSKDGCKLKVGIAKAGYNNVRFKKEEMQFGYFTAEVYKPEGPGDPRLAVFVDATLKAETGFELPIGLTFIGEMGFFRYLGDAWDKYGLWGVLQMVRISGLDAKPSWVEKPKCDGKSLEVRGQAKAGLFTCGALALTTPDLRKVLYFHPEFGYSAEGVPVFDKVVDTSANHDGAVAVFCAEGNKYGERVAIAAITDGERWGKAKEVSDTPKYAQLCKVRPPRVPDHEEEDRWGGKIGGGKPADAPKDRWGGSIGGGANGAGGNPFAEHAFLPTFADRFCRGTVTESDLTTLDRLARNRTVSTRALIALFNLYGAFYSYEFKSELWLNDLYYGAGVTHLPSSCRPMIRAYRAARDIPVVFGKARDRVRATWTAVK